MKIVVFVIILGVRGLITKGNQLYSKGKYEDALKMYKKAQVEAPQRGITDFNIGCAQYKNKDFSKAIKSFKKVTASLGKERMKTKAYYNLGNSLFRKGDLVGAIEMYKEALRRKPDFLEAKINLEFVQKMINQRKQQNKENKQNKRKKEKKKKVKKPQIKKEERKSSSILKSIQEEEKKLRKRMKEKRRKKMKIGIIRDW
jgi:Ca-activated chloride channel family protein